MIPSPIPLFQFMICLCCLNNEIFISPTILFISISLQTFLSQFNINNYKLLFTNHNRIIYLQLIHFFLSTLSLMVHPSTSLATLLPISSPTVLILHIILHIFSLSWWSIIPLICIPFQYVLRKKQTIPLSQSLALLPLCVIVYFLPVKVVNGYIPQILSIIISFLVHIPLSHDPQYRHVSIVITCIISNFLRGTSLLPILVIIPLWYISLPTNNDMQLFSIGGSSGMMRINIPLKVLFTRGLQQTIGHPKSRKLFYYFLINLAFMFVEVAYGWWSGSLGLISDGFHMLFDCVALAMGLVATVIARWAPDRLFTYGYGRSETLSGFVNALFLVYIAFFVLLESIHRLIHPSDIKVDALLMVSFLGLLVNIIGVFAFRDTDEDIEISNCNCPIHLNQPKKKKAKDNNMEGIFLHVLSDTLGSVGVIISSYLVEYFGWVISDPICSLCLSAMIFCSVLPLLKNSASMLLQSVPKGYDDDLIKSKLNQIAGVKDVIKLNLWEFSESCLVATTVISIFPEVDSTTIRSAVITALKHEDFNDITVELVVQ
ncbi:cation transporter putative [Entamoeba histolytica]|nr:cation transporter putative [Entamoeba histolytica]